MATLSCVCYGCEENREEAAAAASVLPPKSSSVSNSSSASSSSSDSSEGDLNGADEALLARKLNALIQANPNYQIVQQNGQRIFEPIRAGSVENFPKGCEVFIGNIPKHVYEERLIPVFQKAGRIYKFRLMLDFNQKTRGYGFVSYFNPADAQRAITLFNGFEMIRDVKLAVYLSIDNRRLFAGNIPKEKTEMEVFDLFRCLVEGVSRVIMYPSWRHPSQNRGFAFIEFESHLQASKARRQLHPRNLFAWEQNLYVDWADPIPAVSTSIMSEVSVLFLNNLPHEATSENLEMIIRGLVTPYVVTRVHKVVTFAFVHCLDRQSAEFVWECLVGLTVFGRDVHIEWARPREFSSQRRAQLPPENFCLSVPVNIRRTIREITKSRRSAASRQNRFDSDNNEDGASG